MLFDRNILRPLAVGIDASSASRTGLSLNTAFSFGVSGNAVAVRFVAPVSANLTDFYFLTSAVAGMAGNLTANVPRVLTIAADPADDHLANEVLEITLTKAASAANLVGLSICVETTFEV